MRSIALASCCILLSLGCQKRDAALPAAPRAKPPPGTAEQRVGSAAFHLELAGVHERYQDPGGAAEHLSKALEVATDAAQRAQALSAVARLREGAGDLDGAIAALERARSELEKAAGAEPAAGAGGPLAAGLAADGDVTIRLARLLSAKGRGADALALLQRASAGAREPWGRQQLLDALVEAHRATGTLDAAVDDRERALDGTPADEDALRFLAVALAADGPAAAPSPAGPPPSPGATPAVTPPGDPGRLARVYERLFALHPEDPQVRQGLLSALERAGRTEDAIKIAAAPAAAGLACAGQPRPAELLQAAEAIRIRARAGQVTKALAEASRLAARARRDGVGAHLVAAELHLEQGAAEGAERLIALAEKGARSTAERRDVALARERVLSQLGRTAELKTLYDGWTRSEDPCLRTAASLRARQLALAPPPPPVGSPEIP